MSTTNTNFWVIIPARSGSKGLKNKNIKILNGIPLIGHTINFAKKLTPKKIFVSTDNEEYASIAKSFGASVPFLRSNQASSDTAMEEDILIELKKRCLQLGIELPDFIVWLRPTFPFRSIDKTRNAIDLLDNKIDSVRLVYQDDPRLYYRDGEYLVPNFNDFGRSMIRRQEFKEHYKVFHTDIFWTKNIDLQEKFLGTKIRYSVISKYEGIDIDGIEDFELAELMLKNNFIHIKEYRHDK